MARLVWRAPLGAVLTLLSLAQKVNSQTLRDDPIRQPAHFANDSLYQSITLEHRIIEVRAELDTSMHLLGTTRGSGRYVVNATWPAPSVLLAARLEPAYGPPAVSLVADGTPSVLMLCSYVGGLGATGLPAYSCMLLVLEGSRRQAFTIDDTTLSSALESSNIASFSRNGSGFSLRFADGPSLRYDGQRLSVGR